jgi:hypothetical protein
MEKQRLTITRALSELKLLNDRILKKIEELSVVGLYQERNNKGVIGTSMTEAEFSKETIADFESLSSLIDRRTRIKSGVMVSNAATKIKIKDREYTVAEAIDKKSAIIYDEKLLVRMKRQFANAISQIEKQKSELEAQINKMVEANLGSDRSVKPEEYNNIAEPLRKANTLNLVDPLKIELKIKTLESEIEEFKTEVDFVLSESNAKTEIEV